ncbi:MAG: ribonuclease Y [Kiritimatiellaeota bacterium]|nr:ribonuclease Y [Kiritimatiellota bacterium]
MDLWTKVIFAASGIGFGMLLSWVFLKMWKTTATTEAARIKEDALKEAEHIKREAKVAAKSEKLKIRDEVEEELKLKRSELLNQERRLGQRESNIEKKADALEARMNAIERREKEAAQIKERITAKEEELSRIISKQVDELERVAQLDRESARELMLKKLEGELVNESGQLIRRVQEEAKQKSERECQKIMVYAMQRYASECTYERTTATIPLPNDEMKGRIIGRDGRNIRALEAATGVNLLIDDTPEAVVISCFDPIRKEVDDEAFSAGEAAVLETGVAGVAPQIIKLIGRLKFRYSFSQNVLKHSLETAYFMGIIAGELGLDERKAKRIGLLHDLGKAVDHEVDGSHATIGADILKKHGEPKDVINAVAAHHNDVEPESIYAILANVCDALSASRPGARSETTEFYLKRLEQLENIAMDFSGVETCYAIQAGREIRVVINPEKINEAKANVLARNICDRIEKEMNYPGQIKVSVIRETRCVDYAK